MHNTDDDFKILDNGGEIRPKHVAQGTLGDCYFLTALISLADSNDGDILENMMYTK